ncbi:MULTISPECIES: hypothetical protein [Pseudofrankia]|uniref:hypothetical protein n=1 Tax=Pseudofrankia TaxID=2994363 RepID=UPI000234BFC4|nr:MULTISPECIES: hypothetical protein [Pseudofrankia]OHV38196.1 hypothetical protein BCD49_14705 [Pseudofrankia sp. EUN1h]
MPPVALTVASAPACLSSRRAAAVAPCPSTAEAVPTPMPVPALAPVLTPVHQEQPAARPRLRLVTPATTPRVDEAEIDEAEIIEIVHGHGGPASCRCRACTMARHPAAALLPRLTVVR